MKAIFVALLLVALVSTSYGSFISKIIREVKHEIQKIENDINKLDLHFNRTAFALGFNEQLNITTNTEAVSCFRYYIPTLESLAEVAEDLEELHLGTALQSFEPLIATLQYFQDECQPAYDAYTTYFGPAVDAFYEDHEAFFHTVAHNLRAHRVRTLLQSVEVALQILNNQSERAGQNFANLVKIGLSSYLPN